MRIGHQVVKLTVTLITITLSSMFVFCATFVEEDQFYNNNPIMNNEISKSEQQEIDQLLNEVTKSALYLAILSIVRDKYLLVFKSENTPMIMGYNYDLIRYTDSSKNNHIEIGNAKVIQIQGNKVVLNSSLYNPEHKLEKSDRLKYE